MTQVALADAAGISQSYVADLESGRRRSSPRQLAAVAAALKVPLDVLSYLDALGGWGRRTASSRVFPRASRGTHKHEPLNLARRLNGLVKTIPGPMSSLRSPPLLSPWDCAALSDTNVSIDAFRPLLDVLYAKLPARRAKSSLISRWHQDQPGPRPKNPHILNSKLQQRRTPGRGRSLRSSASPLTARLWRFVQSGRRPVNDIPTGEVGVEKN
jgi:hypothetical protein